MTKKILAVVVAAMMVMALSVVAFANYDLTGDVTLRDDNQVYMVAIPEGVDVSDGATVTVHVKGTSGNEKIRVYLSDAADAARVTDIDANAGINTIDVVDGAFDGTLDLVINYNGGWGGTSAPTHIIIKAQAWGVEFIDTTLEVVEVVTDGDAAPAEDNAPAEDTTPAETAPAEDTTPAETTPAPAPVETTKAPATGLAIAVVPAIVAMAAVAVSKKR